MKKDLKGKIQTLLWIGAIGIVIALGLFYFPREYAGLGFWQTLYFTLRLFVFEHDLPNFPVSGPLIIILLIQGIQALPGVFVPALPQDLKRVQTAQPS